MIALLRTLATGLLASACLFGSVHAAPALFGNLVANGPRLTVEVDGVVLVSGLEYLQFRELDIADGTHNVRLLDSDTGAVLVEEYPGQPWVVDSSRSQQFPLLLGRDAPTGDYVWFRVSKPPVTQPLPPFYEPRVRIYDLMTNVEHFTIRKECHDPDGSSSSSLHTGGIGSGMFRGRSGFGGSGYDGLDCQLNITIRQAGVSTTFPTFDVSFPEGGVYYLIYVGPGVPQAPNEFILVRNATVSAPPLTPPLDTLRLIKSTHYWYDSGRFSQGATLYEVSRTLAVHGIWNVFAANGRPRWLYLDGGVVDASGRRELLVYEYAMQPGQPRSGQAIGQGTLTYLDCNQAELQVRFADGSTQASQLRRSSPVTQCAAVP